MVKKTKPCNVPQCDGTRTRRGLCARCYAWYNRRVLAGEFTWKEVEEAGIALPGRRTVAEVALERAKKKRVRRS